jgi:hypothetical protein
MDATRIVIDSDAELGGARPRRLWDSENPADIVRLQAQARPSHTAHDIVI